MMHESSHYLENHKFKFELLNNQIKDEKKVFQAKATYFDINDKCFPFTKTLELNFQFAETN